MPRTKITIGRSMCPTGVISMDCWPIISQAKMTLFTLIITHEMTPPLQLNIMIWNVVTLPVQLMIPCDQDMAQYYIHMSHTAVGLCIEPIPRNRSDDRTRHPY